MGDVIFMLEKNFTRPILSGCRIFTPNFPYNIILETENFFEINLTMKLGKTIELLNEKGIGYVLQRALAKIKGEKLPDLEPIQQLFTNASGLEIGGPSPMFRDSGFIPLYKAIKSLDGCNFANNTIWEGDIEGGQTYTYYEGKTGTQFISEASELSEISDGAYDFVISSNCLEHVANPLKAIEEWIRVVKKDGLLLVALPNKAHNFDHKRSITEFSHLLSDFKNGTKEDDLTHLDEILELHDLKMDKPAGNQEQFRTRSLKNPENRALHHHVFDVDLLKEIFAYFNLEIMRTNEGLDHIILGRKL